MGIAYNPRYSSISEITGPSGWYFINTALGPVHTYVDQDYDGGGWALVIANRRFTAGMNNLTYENAISTCNIRTGGTNNGTNIVVPVGSKLTALSDYNVFVGLQYWALLGNRLTSGKITAVQYSAATSGVALGSTGLHQERYRWRFSSFASNYAFTGGEAVADETGTGTPGMYSTHVLAGRGLTTFDFDQDSNSGNCATFYNNNPFWYTSCWSGNQFAGGSFVDAPYWTSSSSGFAREYGAVYIK